MKRSLDHPIDTLPGLTRREFVRAAGTCSAAVAGGIVLGGPAFAEQPAPSPSPKPVVETNIADFLKTPRGRHALPGPFPGRVVKVVDARSLVDDHFDPKVITEMVQKGITRLTGKDLTQSYQMLFDPGDVIGIKVNPVGPPLINTHPELVDAVIQWLTDNGVRPDRIVIWDRFDYMLADAGFTPKRFPGIRLEGLQTMDEKGNTWRGQDGNHVSINNFDRDVFYFAKGVIGKNVRGYENDEFYLNQHVFNGEYSYFGKLLTQTLTKVINIAAYKNTGQGISMATKNLGYGSLCNTGRLHVPLFFNVNTEVLAAPVIRDRLVLNITDGLRAQYDGGPDKNAQFVYPNHALYFATDPFALDMMCHTELVAKRKAMGVAVDTNPRFTEYLRYAQTLGLGVVDAEKMSVVTV